MTNGEWAWWWFPVFFVGLWVAISLFVSRLGGWHDLAGIYRTRQVFVGEKLRWRSAGMRWTTRYGSCLTMGSNQDGLYLAISPLFRAGHPPLFVPWSDISVFPEKVLFWSYARLRFMRVPDVPFRITARTARRLLANGPLRFEAA